MQWGGGGLRRLGTPPSLLQLVLWVSLVSLVSPAPFKEDWPETWPEATDLAFPEEGKYKLP